MNSEKFVNAINGGRDIVLYGHVKKVMVVELFMNIGRPTLYIIPHVS